MYVVSQIERERNIEREREGGGGKECVFLVVREEDIDRE